MVKKIFKVFLVVAVIGLFAYLGIKYFLPEVKELRKLKKEEQELANKIELEERRKKDLIETEKDLRNDSFTIEKAARDKLGLAKEGETIYKFRDEAK